MAEPLLFEDDLPANANWDDLTAHMARLLLRELQGYLGKVALFQAMYPEDSP